MLDFFYFKNDSLNLMCFKKGMEFNCFDDPKEKTSVSLLVRFLRVYLSYMLCILYMHISSKVLFRLME